MSFQVIPAIDLRDGRCVRLFQGDYERETIFSEDPVAVARSWTEQGAERIHVVDLDGAREGEPRHTATIASIRRATGAILDLGGGLRSIDHIAAALGAGIDLTVLGTVAVTDPGLVADVCQRFPGRIAVSIDFSAGRVALRGWRDRSEIDPFELARGLDRSGVAEIIITDIRRDGTLTEPNYDAVRETVGVVNVPVIASGGVAHPDHVAKLKETGAAGVIIGQALYTGDVTFEAARSAAGAAA